MPSQPPSLTEHCLFSTERAVRREEFFPPIYDMMVLLNWDNWVASGNDAGCGGVGNEIGGRGEQMNRH